MKYLKETHGLYWNEAKDTQYNFYKVHIPNAEKQFAAIKNSILELKKLGENSSLKAYVDIRMKILDGEKIMAEKDLEVKRLEMLDRLSELNDFRWENKLSMLVSLGSSSEEDFLAAK